MDTYVCYSADCIYYDDHFCALASYRSPVAIKNGRCVNYATKKEDNHNPCAEKEE